MRTKYLFIIICIGLLHSIVNAQEKKTKTYPTLNIFNKYYYTIEAEEVGYSHFKYTLKNIKDPDNPQERTFAISPNVVDTFVEAFEANIKEILTAEDKKPEASLKFKDEGKRLFYVYIVVNKTLEEQPEGPISGTLFFNDSAKVANKVITNKKLRELRNRLFKEIKNNKTKTTIDVTQATSDTNTTTVGLHIISQDTDTTINVEVVSGDTNTEVSVKGQVIKTSSTVDCKLRSTGFLKLRKEYTCSEKNITEWKKKRKFKKSLAKYIIDSIHISRLDAYKQSLEEYTKSKQAYDAIIREVNTINKEMDNLDVDISTTQEKINELKDTKFASEGELTDLLSDYKTFARRSSFTSADIEDMNMKLKKVVHGKSKDVINSIRENELANKRKNLESDLMENEKKYKLAEDFLDQLESVTLPSTTVDVGSSTFIPIAQANITTIDILTSKAQSITVTHSDLILPIGQQYITEIRNIRNEDVKPNTPTYILLPVKSEKLLERISKLKELIKGTINSIDKSTSDLNLMLTAFDMLESNFNKIQTIHDDIFRSIGYEINALLEKEVDREQSKKDIEQRAENLQEEFEDIEKDYLSNKSRLKKAYNYQIFYTLKINNIDIEFNEGFLENIIVTGKMHPQIKRPYNDAYETDSTALVKFYSFYPIGFSRGKDYDFRKYMLYEGSIGDVKRELPLQNVLTNYVQKLKVDRRDYSPANQSLEIDPSAEKKEKVILRKEPTRRLFEAKVFSDFVGLDESEPNGLIQTEIDKRINLATKKRRIFKIVNIGLLSYLKPFVVISKLESTNKNLPLRYRDVFTNNQYTPVKHASTLDLKRYENFSTGFDLNLTSFDFFLLKSSFMVDFGIAYGRTAIVDSLRSSSIEGIVQKTGFEEEYGVNTFQMSPKFTWLVKADERYRYEVSYQYNIYHLRDNRFRQVANNESFEGNGDAGGKQKHQFSRVEMLATLNTNPKSSGRLFFRYRFYWQQGFWKTGFHQAQVGYSFYLLGRG